MAKIEIPSAASMAELAADRKHVYEKEIMEGPVFREIVQKIEDKAIEGKTKISVTVKDYEHRQILNVIVKHLKAAGYECGFENSGPLLGLITYLTVSWSQGKKASNSGN